MGGDGYCPGGIKRGYKRGNIWVYNKQNTRAFLRKGGRRLVPASLKEGDDPRGEHIG